MKRLLAYLTATTLILGASASAHESIYEAVGEGDIYAGRPFVDPETGYLFVDPDGMRDLRWQSDGMTAVRVADNDYTSIPIAPPPTQGDAR